MTRVSERPHRDKCLKWLSATRCLCIVIYQRMLPTDILKTFIRKSVVRKAQGSIKSAVLGIVRGKWTECKYINILTVQVNVPFLYDLQFYILHYLHSLSCISKNTYRDIINIIIRIGLSSFYLHLVGNLLVS